MYFRNVISKSYSLCYPVLKKTSLVKRNIIPSCQYNGYFIYTRSLSVIDSKIHLKPKQLLQPCNGLNTQRCCKSSKKGRSDSYNEDYDYDSDSDAEDGATLHEDDLEMTNSYKDLTVHAQSLRADGILARALNVSRKVVDDAFLGSKLRLNDVTLPKKSKQVTEDDCLELILKTEAEGEESFKRVRILKISEQKTQKEKFKVKVRAWRGRNTREVENTWRPRTE